MIKKFINKILNPNKGNDAQEGTVKFFNNTKGFGFITYKDSDKEIFVHSTNLVDKIRENDHVVFDVEEGEKGLSAVNVRLVK